MWAGAFVGKWNIILFETRHNYHKQMNLSSYIGLGTYQMNMTVAFGDIKFVKKHLICEKRYVDQCATVIGDVPACPPRMTDVNPCLCQKLICVSRSNMSSMTQTFMYT